MQRKTVTVPVVYFAYICVMLDTVEFRFKLQVGGFRRTDRKSSNFSISWRQSPDLVKTDFFPLLPLETADL